MNCCHLKLDDFRALKAGFSFEKDGKTKRVKNVKTFVRWPVLIVAELLSFTVRRSLDARAVKNGFSFKN